MFMTRLYACGLVLLVAATSPATAQIISEDEAAPELAAKAPESRQRASDIRSVDVVTPSGEPANGAKVFICIGDRFTVYGPMQRVNLLASETRSFHGVPSGHMGMGGMGGMDMGMGGGMGMDAGMDMRSRNAASSVERAKKLVFETVVKQGRFEVDLAAPPFTSNEKHDDAESDGGMGGEMGEEGMGGFDSVGFGSMGGGSMSSRSGHPSAFYYVVHPEHGCAFLPRRNTPPKRIVLKPAAEVVVATPGIFDPKDYVILACWRNRFADPIVELPHTFPAKFFPGLGGGMGGMGGMASMMGGGMMGSMEEASVSKGLSIMPAAFDDWRLQTRVTHWNVLPLQPSKDQKGYSKTKLIFPPGETRLTLLPKSVATEQLAELKRSSHPNETLDRLSLFGGPSTIVRASPHQKNTYQGAILPSRPAHNLELLGRADVSGMPDWSGEEHYLFLTKYESEQDASKPVVLRDQQATVRYAETRFSERNQFDFGRLAHKIGDQQYAVVGLLPGYYYVWSLPPSKLPELIRQSQNGDEAAIKRILQPLSVVAVSPQQKTMFLEGVVGSPAKFEFEPTHWKPMPTYRLLPFDSEFSSKPRTLIEMTRPLKFEPVDPDLDPFSAKTLPNENVGIKTESELKLEDRRKSMTRAQAKMDEISKDHIPVGQPVMPGEVIATIDDEAAAKALRERMQPRPLRGSPKQGKEEAASSENSPAAKSPLDQAKVEGLRRRIERMEQELAKAKRMLEELAPQSDEKRPRSTRR